MLPVLLNRITVHGKLHSHAGVNHCSGFQLISEMGIIDYFCRREIGSRESHHYIETSTVNTGSSCITGQVMEYATTKIIHM